MKKIAVVLSGCGVFDGSEIHESVCTLLALDRANIQYDCFAPNILQTKVVNHLTKEVMNEKRNVLVEAARIARGKIANIKEAHAHHYDAAIYPGGVGAASNLSNFVDEGAACQVQADVLAFAQAMASAKKPQGFICIAPTMISKIYGPGVRQTIGTDVATAKAITAMGGEHVNAAVLEVVVDKKHKVVSTPAYMLAKSISEVGNGVSELVDAIVMMLEP